MEAGLDKYLLDRDRKTGSFIPAFAVPVAGVHGVALGGARFVNDALEEAADRRVRQRARIIAFGILKHLVLAVRLVQRNFRRLLEPADFKSTLRALVQKLNELLVDFVDAASPVTQVHGATSRRERPCRAASLSDRTRSASAVAPPSTDFAFSISETSAEPTTAASAKPPSTETWPGSEMPKPTAMGSCVTLRVRRKSAGRSSGKASFAPVTPVREMR